MCTVNFFVDCNYLFIAYSTFKLQTSTQSALEAGIFTSHIYIPYLHTVPVFTWYRTDTKIRCIGL